MPSRPALLLSALLLALALLLTGCGPREAASVSQTMQQAVSGTFDRQADRRERLPGRTRRAATWTSEVPLDARGLRVTYDTDVRGLSWRADVTESRVAPVTLLAAEELRRVGTLTGGGAAGSDPAGQNEVREVRGGPFDRTLVVGGETSFAVMTKAYVLRYEPDLLKFAR